MSQKVETAGIEPAQGFTRPNVDDHWLYRCFDRDGGLLYVGITSGGVKRFREHGNTKDWWPRVASITIEHFTTAADAHAAEVAAIAREHPRHNRNHVEPETNVAQMYRRCRLCGEHYRPTVEHRLKTVCAGCRGSGDSIRPDKEPS